MTAGNTTTRPVGIGALAGTLLAALALGYTGAAWAAPASSDTRPLCLAVESEPVLTMGDVVISQADLDAHMSQLPEDNRAQAVSSTERIDKLLQALLVQKALFEDARLAGLLEEEPLAALANYRVVTALADEQMKRHIESRLLDEYETQARELYLTDPDRFAPAPTYDFTHVLISTAQHEEAEAMRLILELYDRVKQGESLDALAAEYSDDQASKEDGGAYKDHPLERLDRNFARALAELEKPGDVTGPVRSRFGWHLIRLDKQRAPETPEWEDVREQAMELARQRHADRIGKAYTAELIDADAIEVVPGAIERFQKRHGYDPEKARQALQNAD